jgi:hypothetical protein
MVRYDLNLKGKSELFEDGEAPDFASLTKAQREALRALGRIPADALVVARSPSAGAIGITDGEVPVIPIADVLPSSLRQQIAHGIAPPLETTCTMESGIAVVRSDGL